MPTQRKRTVGGGQYHCTDGLQFDSCLVVSNPVKLETSFSQTVYYLFKSGVNMLL